MQINTCMKETFSVIGKEGSTNMGEGFISKLWEDANAHFHEIEHLTQKDGKGNIKGIWGNMSDFSHSFLPWENGFSKGLYLAGVECMEGAIPPDGWTKWVIPGYEYIYVENDKSDTFPNVISYLKDHNITLVGAVHDFNCPITGKAYLYFPIKRL